MKRLEIDMKPKVGNPLLLVALVVASLVITTLWYREGPGGPLHFSRKVVLAVSEPFQWTGTTVAAPFRAASRYLSDIAVSRDEIEQYRRQNAELLRRLADAEEQAQRAKRIVPLASFIATQTYKTVLADVIGRPSESWERTIVVDRGSSSGIETGSPVFAGGGDLVGQVMEVAPWSSKVRLITAADSGVAVRVQRTRAEGVVRGSVDGTLLLEFVFAKAPVRGDTVVTSGTGGVYPSGLLVGYVDEVAPAQAGMPPRTTVTSLVDLDRIEEVAVKLGSAMAVAGGDE